jgi:hypothetical protein
MNHRAIEVCYGLPDFNELNLQHNFLPVLLILDDLMLQVLNSAEMCELFTVFVHHKNISVIYTLQNYFAPSKFGKTISRNIHYKVLFFNRTELVELRNLSQQIMPHCPNFLHFNFQVLEQQFHNKYLQYLLIDGHSKSELSKMHVRSQIFPNEKGEIIPIIFFPNTFQST